MNFPFHCQPYWRNRIPEKFHGPLSLLPIDVLDFSLLFVYHTALMGPDIKQEFDKRRPWITKFFIQGRSFGGDYDPSDDMRIALFQRHFPEAKRILELGALEGGHSFALSKNPRVTKLLAVEGREKNLEKARFVQALLQDRKVEFHKANLEKCDLAGLGRFDAVLCVGLLYHLAKPWKLIEQIARVSKGLFLWTHYASSGKADKKRLNYPGLLFREWRFFYESRSGLSPLSFWPTLNGLKQMLLDYGFSQIEILQDEPDHEHGPAVTLVSRQP